MCYTPFVAVFVGTTGATGVAGDCCCFFFAEGVTTALPKILI
jgi:hypothetical protein